MPLPNAWILVNRARAAQSAPDTTSTPEPTLEPTPEPVGGDRVAINSASKTDLTSLDGVGPATADRIIERRPYADLDDLITRAELTRFNTPSEREYLMASISFD